MCMWWPRKVTCQVDIGLHFRISALSTSLVEGMLLPHTSLSGISHLHIPPLTSAQVLLG